MFVTPTAFPNGPQSIVLTALPSDGYMIRQRFFNGTCWEPWVDSGVTSNTPPGIALGGAFLSDYLWVTRDIPAAGGAPVVPSIAVSPGGEQQKVAAGDTPVLLWAKRQLKWSNIANTGGGTTGYPAIVEMDAGTGRQYAYLFARNSSGDMYWCSYSAYQLSFSGWFLLGGQLSASPCAVGWPVTDAIQMGRMWAFAVTGQGNVLCRDYYYELTGATNDNGWAKDWGVLGTGMAASDPCVAYRSHDYFDVFVLGKKYGVQWRPYRGTWTTKDWVALGGMAVTRPTACWRGNGMLDVFFGGADGQVYWGTYDGVNWSPWLPEAEWGQCQ